MQNVIAFNSATYDKCQTVATVFVNQCQDFNRPAVMGAIHHKIIGPDMIAVSRTLPDA